MSKKDGVIEYEVVADYPAAIFDVGDRIKVSEATHMAYLTEGDKYDLREFPHLFKKIESKTKE